jgi:hypothetical protein
MTLETIGEEDEANPKFLSTVMPRKEGTGDRSLETISYLANGEDPSPGGSS